MTQVISVRFFNPESGEVVAPDSFTRAYGHREAIELALREKFGNAVQLRETEQTSEEQFVSAPAQCWKSSYRCVIDVRGEEEPREMGAVLFAQYKEKKQ